MALPRPLEDWPISVESCGCSDTTILWLTNIMHKVIVICVTFSATMVGCSLEMRENLAVFVQSKLFLLLYKAYGSIKDIIKLNEKSRERHNHKPQPKMF